jgi:copper chaperone CopZ
MKEAPSVKSEKLNPKIQELVNIVNQEIENIHEIIDGGYGTFGVELGEARNQVYRCLKEIKEILEQEDGLWSPVSSVDYDILGQDKSVYIQALKSSLNRIKELIDEAPLLPELKLTLLIKISEAKEAYTQIEAYEPPL